MSAGLSTIREAQPTPLVQFAPTTALPPWGTGVVLPNTLAELLDSSSASPAGYSAVSSYLTCPEHSRLRRIGVRRKPSNYVSYELEDLDALYFGVLIHALRAARLVFGVEAPYICLDRWRNQMTDNDYNKALLLFRLYDQSYPFGYDPFDYIGVEVQVQTDVKTREGAPCLRTVRYDSVVKLRDGSGVLSFEAKTMAKKGRSTLQGYFVQAMCQMALWNANHDLVRQHGPMKGVLFDCYVKTAVPSVEREQEFFSNTQQQLALSYLRSPDGAVQFSADERGHYPRMLHACWGKWRPCEAIGICHDQAYGDYQLPDGSTYDGR